MKIGVSPEPRVTDKWHDVIPFVKVLMNMVISQIIADVITSPNIRFCVLILCLLPVVIVIREKRVSDVMSQTEKKFKTQTKKARMTDDCFTQTHKPLVFQNHVFKTKT